MVVKYARSAYDVDWTGFDCLEGLEVWTGLHMAFRTVGLLETYVNDNTLDFCG